MGLFSKDKPEAPKADYSHGLGQNFEDLHRSFGGDKKLIDAAVCARAKARHTDRRDTAELDFEDAVACKAYLFDAHGRSRA